MECTFKGLLPSCSQGKKFEKNILSQLRKEKVITSSKERKDNFHIKIESISSELKCHSDCYREYTSKEKIARWLNKIKDSEDLTPPTKRLRRFHQFTVFSE